MKESYILTRSMHFGFLKESFGRGAVITFDPATRKVTIDGRQFEDYRDVEILKRQAIKKPHSPWVVPYSDEVLQDIRGESGESAPVVEPRPGNGDGMKIIQSDEDSHQTIDIRHTKVAANNAADRDAQKQRVKDNGMEIIQGDESVEDRIARLKTAKDTDLSARAERVRLMREPAKMPIVADDGTLGSQGESSGSSMNAGMPVGGRRADSAPESVAAAAAARKAQVEANRQRVAAELGLDPDQAGIDEVTPSGAPVDARDEEIAALRAAIAAENEPPAPPPVPVVDPRDAEIAALRAELADSKARKVPVTSDEDVAAFAED